MHNDTETQELMLHPTKDVAVSARSCRTQIAYGTVIARVRSAIQAVDLWIIAETDLRSVLQQGGYTSCAVREFVFSHPRIINEISTQSEGAVGDALLRLVVTDTLTDGVTLRWTCPKTSLQRYHNEFLDDLGERFSKAFDRIVSHVHTGTEQPVRKSSTEGVFLGQM